MLNPQVTFKNTYIKSIANFQFYTPEIKYNCRKQNLYFLDAFMMKLNYVTLDLRHSKKKNEVFGTKTKS